MRILLLITKLEPSDLANERWAQLSSSLRDHGLSLICVGVQAGRKLDSVALHQAQDAHARQAFDLVISSGPPIGAHLTALAFSKVAGISWVADWVEPFALLAHKTAPVLIPTMHLTGGIADGPFALLAHKMAPDGLFALLAHKTAPDGLFALEIHKVLGWFDRRLEAKLLRAANQVLVSSEALAHKYRAFRGDRDASLLVVRNGFDRNELRPSNQRAERKRLRIVCSQITFNPLPFLESLQTRANLRESLEVVFSHASAQVAQLVQAFELEDCVHCLNASESETAALELSADVLLTFGLNSAYRTPAGLARVLARQHPILHIFENALDPSFEVFEGTAHLSSENNRFALTAALEAAIQGDWVMPGKVSGVLSPEQYCWDAIGRSLIGFICVAGSDRAVSGVAAGVARQAVSGVTAKT